MEWKGCDGWKANKRKEKELWFYHRQPAWNFHRIHKSTKYNLLEQINFLPFTFSLIKHWEDDDDEENLKEEN